MRRIVLPRMRPILALIKQRLRLGLKRHILDLEIRRQIPHILVIDFPDSRQVRFPIRQPRRRRRKIRLPIRAERSPEAPSPTALEPSRTRGE